MYFEVDEESSEYKKIDPQVLTNYLLVFGQKHIFSRKNTMHLYPYPHPHYDFFEKFVKLSCFRNVFWMWMKYYTCFSGGEIFLGERKKNLF